MKFTSLLKSLIVEQSRFEVLLNNLTKPGEDKEGNKTKPKLSKKGDANDVSHSGKLRLMGKI